MADVRDYGKIAFTDGEGVVRLIQPKSFTRATSAEKKQLLELVMSDEYMQVLVLMPRDTKSMRASDK